MKLGVKKQMLATPKGLNYHSLTEFTSSTPLQGLVNLVYVTPSFTRGYSS
jgi:hypothetical protein